MKTLLFLVLVTLIVGTGECQRTVQDETKEVLVSQLDICPLVMCAVFCPDGMELDAKGCSTCICKNEVHVSQLDICPLVLCAVFCPGGMELDAKGCSTCICKDGGNMA